MKKLEVFYHLYIPFTDAAGHCTWWIDSILSKIRDSKLANSAKMYVCITMPMYITSTNNGVPVISHKTKQRFTFFQGLLEYIEMRYPWVEVLDVRDVNDTNIYEGQTLNAMRQRCSEDANVLYIHSKGIYTTCFQTAAWRDVLEHYMINEWRECVSKLDNCDVVTVKDSHIVNSGNIYWAKGSYLKTLADPLEAQNYLLPEKSEMYPGTPLFRYAFELWITSKQPKIEHIHEIGCNPYEEFWFLERTLNK